MEKIIEFLNNKFDNKVGQQIGYGRESLVYEHNSDKVIKLTNVDNINNLNKIVNKDYDRIAKIYETGTFDPPKELIKDGKLFTSIETRDELSGVVKFGELEELLKNSVDLLKKNEVGYIIMEKLNTDIREKIQHEEQNIYNVLFSLDMVKKLPEDFQEIYKRLVEREGKVNTLTLLFQFVKKNHLKLIDLLKKRDYYTDFTAELIEVLVNVKKVFPNWSDIFEGQFGINSEGKLVAFDLD